MTLPTQNNFEHYAVSLYLYPSEHTCINTSSAVMVVAGLGPGLSFLLRPYFFQVFLSAIVLATLCFSIL